MSDIGPEANRLQRGQSGAPGRTGPRSIGALDLAERASAIAYESPSNINIRVSRRYTGGQPPGGRSPRPKTRPKNNPLVFPPKIP